MRQIPGWKGCLALGLALCVTACSLAQPVKTPTPKSMLWKISASTCSVFLLGSLHLLKADDYPLPAAFEEAFTNSTAIIFEVDPNILHSPETAQKMLKKAMLPPDDGLSKQLSTDTYTLLKAKLDEIGMDVAGFERFKPWFLSLTLSIAKLQGLGFSPLYGIDRHYFDRTKITGKTVDGLETVDDQLALFEDLSARSQDDLIRQTIQEMDSIEKQMLTMRAAWRTGNAEQLADTLMKDLGKYPEVYEALFTRRNKKWLPKIEALFNKKGSYLVIVGAGHLIGKDGLLDLLKKKGYSLQQL